jgi:phosphatidate cytidylyltransferase
MLPDLLKRSFVSSLIVAAAGFLLYFAWNPWVAPLLVLVTMALGVAAAKEFRQLAETKRVKIPLFPYLTLVGLQIVAFFFGLEIPFLVLAILLLFLLHFRSVENGMIDLSFSVFGLVYIALPLGLFLTIVYQAGIQWAAYLVVVTKATDIGAYLTGSLVGKRLLAPRISPKKTIEGAFGGLFFALGVTFLFHLPLWIGLVLGIAAQLGDLAESLLKRDANVKDSGALPALGGALDLVDSLLFTIPIFYCLL